MQVSGGNNTESVRQSDLYKVMQKPVDETSVKEANKQVVETKQSFSLSSEAKSLDNAKKALENVPDIRQDKVDELKKLIESGKYNVPGADVAAKMTKSLGL